MQSFDRLRMRGKGLRMKVLVDEDRLEDQDAIALVSAPGPFDCPASFSPQRESRTLPPIQPDAGLQEWSGWDDGLSTRRVLLGITVLAFDQGSGFPLRRE